MSLGVIYHLLAALGYAALAIYVWQPLIAGHEHIKSGPTTRAGLLIVLLLHAAALQQSLLGYHTLHLGWALALSAAVWLGMLVFWLESFVIRLDGLLLILLPASAAVTLLAAVFPQDHSVAHADSTWMRIHLLIALIAYGIITVAALQSLLMAALDHYLHRPVTPTESRGTLGRALDTIPPLLVQERLLFRLISLGFFMLCLTVITGAIVSWQIVGVLFPFDHKTVFTLLSWFTFGVLLLGRRYRGWRGPIALRWTLAGFAFILLSYTGSRFVIDMILQRG